EMVSIESQLYKAHPEWVIAIPGRQASVSKHQYILDLSRQDVREYLYRTLSELFRLAQVDYIKWDFNRTFSDLYSSNAEIRHYGEFLHRYTLGLYELLEKLTHAFPQVLFETTRFDLGMLCYMSQAEVSKTTDVLARLAIQESSSFAYPLSTISATVTAGANHQSLRSSDLESAFNVAAFGSLGYSIDLGRLKRTEREMIRSQIAFYKGYRAILQYGVFTRVQLISEGENQIIWAVASADKQTLLVLFAQRVATINPPLDTLRIKAVDTNIVYEVFPRQQRLDMQLLGELTKHLSPLPTTEGGIVQETISKAISLDSEVEHYRASGEQIAYKGIKLNPQYNGTGFDAMTRSIGDMGSRIYLFKAVDPTA
ncbi:MAG TPA: alpha-galactosidase, partial [Sphaerochaeta sp.]|nr:alpha-galactosidase [Sphaerochaeta sp.]